MFWFSCWLISILFLSPVVFALRFGFKILIVRHWKDQVSSWTLYVLEILLTLLAWVSSIMALFLGRIASLPVVSLSLSLGSIAASLLSLFFFWLSTRGFEWGGGLIEGPGFVKTGSWLEHRIGPGQHRLPRFQYFQPERQMTRTLEFRGIVQIRITARQNKWMTLETFEQEANRRIEEFRRHVQVMIEYSQRRHESVELGVKVSLEGEEQRNDFGQNIFEVILTDPIVKFHRPVEQPEVRA
jgi:hypothetical protein